VNGPRIGWAAVVGLALTLGGGIPAGAYPRHHKNSTEQSKPAKQPAEKCAVKKSEISNPASAQTLMVNDQQLRFCCPECVETFKQAPEKYLKSLEDPVSGFRFKLSPQSPRLMHEGALYIFMNAANEAKFQSHPDVWIRILRHEPSQ